MPASVWTAAGTATHRVRCDQGRQFCYGGGMPSDLAAPPDNNLATVDRHLRRRRLMLIERQLMVIARLQAAGADTTLAKNVLHTLLRSQELQALLSGKAVPAPSANPPQSF